MRRKLASVLNVPNVHISRMSSLKDAFSSMCSLKGGHPQQVDENTVDSRLLLLRILSNLDSFSSLMRKICLTPSHLKLTDFTPSRIISPRFISSPHFISPDYNSFPLISPHLMSSQLILLHHMSRHDIWSHLTSSHLENALKSIIQSTKNGEFCA